MTPHPASNAHRSTLTLHRSSEFINGFRNYTIEIDGQPAGCIANGETKDFTLSPGTHTICARIDWCSSPELEITIQENEVKNLHVSAYKEAKKQLPFGIIFGILCLLLPFFTDRGMVLILAVPLIFIFGNLFYHLTLGRKKYLLLQVSEPQEQGLLAAH